MARHLWICVGLLSAGCAQTPSTTPAPPSDQGQAVADDPMDAFVVMIGAERWGVLIDRAREGVRETRPADAALDESQILRADHAVKSGAAELILLRNEICAKGLMTGDACTLNAWPEWTLEAPDPTTSLAVVEARSDWLGATMQSFVALGCEAGRTATDEEMYCSVE